MPAAADFKLSIASVAVNSVCRWKLWSNFFGMRCAIVILLYYPCLQQLTAGRNPTSFLVENHKIQDLWISTGESGRKQWTSVVVCKALRGGSSIPKEETDFDRSSSDRYISSDSHSHDSVGESCQQGSLEPESWSHDENLDEEERKVLQYGRNDRILTDEDVTELIAEWDNETQWANATLLPLFFGESTPEEVHWEEERLYGDLIFYRNNGVPSEKWKKWRAAEDERNAAVAAERRAAMRSAEDLSLPSEWSDDDEPNWCRIFSFTLHFCLFYV
jgi:hypothetical protein